MIRITERDQFGRPTKFEAGEPDSRLRTATKWILRVVFLGLIVWDVFVNRAAGFAATISNVIYSWSLEYWWFAPIVLLIVGGLACHVFRDNHSLPFFGSVGWWLADIATISIGYWLIVLAQRRLGGGW